MAFAMQVLHNWILNLEIKKKIISINEPQHNVAGIVP